MDTSVEDGKEEWFKQNLFFRSILHTLAELGYGEFEKGRFKDYLRVLAFASSPA